MLAENLLIRKGAFTGLEEIEVCVKTQYSTNKCRAKRRFAQKKKGENNDAL